jgi:predicted phosphodiesterase
VRLAIISDTHLPRGRRRLPERCMAELGRADLILHGGDIATADVLDELEAIGPPVHAVLGNVDRDPALAGRVPVTRVVEAGGARIAMVHDAGRPRGRSRGCARASPTRTSSSSGTRTSRCTRPARTACRSSIPGSPTDRRRQPRHTMGIAEIAGGRVTLRHLALD